ncbi:protein of unknown function [Geodermatophilus telluris]|uniref:DUF4184 family protein n=1 Tax=Geodermatophilus telluris TaxID=1190417 RepID=A0A1G6J6M0_9ACTN|nr:DUF4184 family protein [Geodermatophilus telluris]SDC14317.1 protein of unknown function [Geodermatophilus telluris]
MPFTGSHPAAVLPLLRTGLPASALVAGSLAPDVPLFLPGGPGWPTHDPLAVLTLDVVLGGVLWALWHGLLAAPALAAAPDGLRRRVTVPVGLRPRLVPVRAVAAVPVALALGAATHVGWDQFTHGWGWGTRHLPVLRAPVGRLGGVDWYGHDVAQHASTLLGAAVVAAWLVRWWRRTPAAPGDLRGGARPVWAALLGLGALTGGAAAVRAPDVLQAGVAGATAGGAVTALAAGLAAAGWHVRRRRRA